MREAFDAVRCAVNCDTARSELPSRLTSIVCAADGRYGRYLVGVDWVADHIVLPLQWAEIVCAVVAHSAAGGRGRLALCSYC